jgi:hypothetical protein
MRRDRYKLAIAPLLTAGASATALSACGAGQPIAGSVVADRATVAAAKANPITISPLPGAADASPTTQISFLGGPATRVVAVTVTGSRSGRHRGVLRAYSTGTGESFLPNAPFRQGERVNVHARVRKDGSIRTAITTFTIAHQARVDQGEFPNNAGNPEAVQHYRSAPALTPSALRVTTSPKPGASAGYLFLAPYQGAGTPGPMIADQKGQLVWFHPLATHQVATRFGVQQYLGKPVLTWWQGKVLGVGFGRGEDVIYDSSYRPLTSVRAGNGYYADLHEIRLTPQGTAWIDIFDPVRMILSSVHGSRNGVLTDSVIQEIDIKTGLVMWEWHALDHVPRSASYNPAPHSSYPWDYIHINSVDPGSDGDLLLSARNSWALYDVDLHSGGFRWRIGGAHSGLRLGPGVRFYWQHDAEFQSGGLISVFDNGSNPPKEKQSRGLLLKPNFRARTVALVKELANPSQTLLSESQGNLLSLPGGNWLLGYGRLPNVTEFDPAGRVLLDATLGKQVQNYSSSLSQWQAQPNHPPSVSARPASNATTVYASWNGATNVANWRVLAGGAPGRLAPVATAPRTGFETAITITGAPPYIAVQALNSAGDVLSNSAAISG